MCGRGTMPTSVGADKGFSGTAIENYPQPLSNIYRGAESAPWAYFRRRALFRDRNPKASLFRKPAWIVRVALPGCCSSWLRRRRHVRRSSSRAVGALGRMRSSSTHLIYSSRSSASIRSNNTGTTIRSRHAAAETTERDSLIPPHTPPHIPSA